MNNVSVVVSSAAYDKISYILFARTVAPARRFDTYSKLCVMLKLIGSFSEMRD